MTIRKAILLYLRGRRRASVNLKTSKSHGIPDPRDSIAANDDDSTRGCDLTVHTQFTDLTINDPRPSCMMSQSIDSARPCHKRAVSSTNGGNDLVMGENEGRTVDDAEVDERHHHPERGMWSNPVEFFLTCLGYTVGLGNIWRFPYLCYTNGGGAFLIPYIIMLIFTGLPLYGLELCLGQYASLGPNQVFTKMMPMFQGLGYAVLLVAFYTAIYYNVIIAWTIFYFFASIGSDVPWKYCGNSFNTDSCYSPTQQEQCRQTNESLTFWNNTCVPVEVVCKSTLNRCWAPSTEGIDDENTLCDQAFHRPWNFTHCLNTSAMVAGEGDPYLYVPLKIVFRHTSASEEYFTNYMLGQSSGWEDFGGLKWDLVLCSALAWILVAAALLKGVESSGKVVYFTALFPYVVLVIFCVKGSTLPGAYNGFMYFVTPKWNLLLKPKVWVAAATQNFYSLGPAFGGLISFASYNKFDHNCLRDAILLGAADALTSFFAGSVVFAIVGYMAHELQSPIHEVIKSGAGLAFIAYPDAIGEMKLAPLWGLLFFAMLMTCGFDSEFTMVETLLTALLDEKPSLRRYKGWVTASVCFLGFILGLSMCARGGIYMFTLFDHYSAGWAVLLLGITEAIVTVYIYGYDRFIGNVREMMPKIFPFEFYWKYTWKFTSPGIVLIVVVATWIEHEPITYEGVVFPDGIEVLGWLMGISPIVVLVGFTIYNICSAKKKGMPIKSLLEPRPDWGPVNKPVNEDSPLQIKVEEKPGNEISIISHPKLVHRDTESTII